jgi:hypothetical protein
MAFGLGSGNEEGNDGRSKHGVVQGGGAKAVGLGNEGDGGAHLRRASLRQRKWRFGGNPVGVYGPGEAL